MKVRPPQTLCFDFDGTLCTNTGGAYDTAEPFPWAIERVNALAAAGYRIIIFTARGTATGIDWREVTEGQLERWGVRYDELHLGKPSAAVYIDDRAVHTTDWQGDDAFAPPGFGVRRLDGPVEELPAPTPPQFPAAVEHGRTFGGRPARLDSHIDRALALAEILGLRQLPAREEIRAAVQAALAHGAGHDDLLYTISLAAEGDAAHLDVWRDAPTPRTVLHVACRPLTELTAALAPLLVAGSDPPAVAATTPEQERPASAWPLRVDASGAVGDGLGGRLVISTGGRLVAEPEPGLPSVASVWLSELAAAAGLAVDERPITPDELRAADGAAVAGLPFGLLGLGIVDGQAVGYDDVLTGLRARWAEDAAP